MTNFVKICGVTNVHDARSVVASRADALGLILAKSSRRVSRDTARAISGAVNGQIKRALVFRESSDEYILESSAYIGAEVAQVHGAISDRLYEGLRAQDLLIVKALVIDSEEFHGFEDDLVDAVLIDGPNPGSGVAHPWGALGSRTFTKPVIVAGGLNAENVAETIELTRAWGVDCASGVEESAGLKDPTLVSRFVKNARTGFDQREARE